MANVNQVTMLQAIATQRNIKLPDKKFLMKLSNADVNKLKVVLSNSPDEIYLDDPVLREVECSYCDAKPGEKCWGVIRKRVERKRRETVHPDRLRLYKQTSVG